jgi:hypothetical protein
MDDRRYTIIHRRHASQATSHAPTAWTSRTMGWPGTWTKRGTISMKKENWPAMSSTTSA